ncbi:transmembrane glycoprotein NMB [Phodopus roborovskii]|uniref:Transmembrane glycoprotein NMB n=1 Tax=Phodopus roborovskii TaxID=109678 RepID=A0AAV0A3K7_PHORO|nr:transmembrane glycoprotein NMB [Phodopus roborovskii]CAH7153082.1 Gpnmb [Phodopus roborovskii]
MESFFGVLGFLLLASGLPLQEAKRFRDVLGHEQYPGHLREHSQLRGWSSDETEWNENLYPVWKRGDGMWKSSWEGGRVQAVLTSDSPALVGSNITFVVNLVFPRCQKEDANGNIVYEKNCRNDLGFTPDRYVYNWTAGAEDGDWEGSTSQSEHLEFPDGKPFPRPHGRKRWSFVYVFHTLGQYFQKLGRCSARVSVNTTNMTLGHQVMEVTVFRRYGRAYIPIAQVKDVYAITDQIPVFVTMSQKNDRNSSDETFLRDLPIVFDVLIHDPSHFLNDTAISYKWNFGDNTGLFVSNNHTLNHTYVLNGTFNLNLTVQAAVSGPCPSPSPPSTPTPPTPTRPTASPSLMPTGYNSMELSDISSENCQINRYGYFRATITIVEGIVEVNIIQIADVPVPMPQPVNSLMDFTVACKGAAPTEVCTIVSDPTCRMAQSRVCSPVAVDQACLLSVRRAFNGSGMFCVNVTLGDDTSLAFTSTLIAIPGKDPASPLRMENGVLIAISCLALLVTMVTILLYKKHEAYKPIGNCPRKTVKDKSLSVFLSHAKAPFLQGNREKDPLLQCKPGMS